VAISRARLPLSWPLHIGEIEPSPFGDTAGPDMDGEASFSVSYHELAALDVFHLAIAPEAVSLRGGGQMFDILNPSSRSIFTRAKQFLESNLTDDFPEIHSKYRKDIRGCCRNYLHLNMSQID
jgi:hypothetical protein